MNFISESYGRSEDNEQVINLAKSLNLDIKQPSKMSLIILDCCQLKAFLGVCILTVAAKYIFKNPNLHSKFGRKNSYGTLNTMASGKQPKKVQTF